MEGRAGIFMKADQPVGIAYNRIRDAMHRGFKDRMAFIEFDLLTSRPKDMMNAVYEFLEEPYYQGHDFKNVEQTTSENDDIHGIPGLHVIRPEIKPVKSDALEVLGQDTFDKFNNAEFWR